MCNTVFHRGSNILARQQLGFCLALPRLTPARVHLNNSAPLEAAHAVQGLQVTAELRTAMLSDPARVLLPERNDIKKAPEGTPASHPSGSCTVSELESCTSSLHWTTLENVVMDEPRRHYPQVSGLPFFGGVLDNFRVSGATKPQ